MLPFQTKQTYCLAGTVSPLVRTLARKAYEFEHWAPQARCASTVFTRVILFLISRSIRALLPLLCLTSCNNSVKKTISLLEFAHKLVHVYALRRLYSEAYFPFLLKRSGCIPVSASGSNSQLNCSSLSLRPTWHDAPHILGMSATASQDPLSCCRGSSRAHEAGRPHSVLEPISARVVGTSVAATGPPGGRCWN